MIDFRLSKRKIAALESRVERVDFLIANWRGKPGGQDFLRAERAALRWALEIVRERLDAEGIT